MVCGNRLHIQDECMEFASQRFPSAMNLNEFRQVVIVKRHNTKNGFT